MELETPITGQAIAGLTSPTYTIATDAPLELNQKAYTVTAVGGTQTGVLPHSIVAPFQLIISRPKVIRAPVFFEAGVVGIQPTPMNEHKFMTRKAVLVNGAYAMGRMLITTTISVPAGAPLYDAVSIDAALSCHIGALKQNGDDWHNAVISGSF